MAGTRGATRLWDMTSRNRHGSALPGAGDTILAMAFSPDRQTLYVAGNRVVLQKFTIAPEKAAAAVCQRAGELSRVDWKTYIPAVPYRPAC